MRFVLEIYNAIRQQVGKNFPVGIKLNSADFMKDGFSEEDSMQVIEALSKAGIDLIEISGGTYENPSMMGSSKTAQREAYFLNYAKKARKHVSTPLVVTGGFRSAKVMQDAIASGATDMVGLARPLTIDPELPEKVMNDSEYTLEFKTPSTGFKQVDSMTGLGIVWYEQQIHRLAKGKQPKPDLSAWKVVAATLAGIGIHAFKKRRA